MYRVLFRCQGVGRPECLQGALEVPGAGAALAVAVGPKCLGTVSGRFIGVSPLFR